MPLPALPPQVSPELYAWVQQVHAIAQAAETGRQFRAGAKAYLTADQSIPASTTTPIAFNAEEYDSSGYHDNATANTRFTVPTGLGGKYLLVGVLSFAASGSGLRFWNVRKNGSTVVHDQGALPMGASDITRVSFSTIIQLVAGDYVELQAYQTAVGALPVLANSYFSVTLIGT
jgi:hypothetical protein